ncbi:MAG: Uma2 family endonuclease [Acidobacteria bacterium]|nr:Uma2 family endonuclease [Acidobacteriota bacterium]
MTTLADLTEAAVESGAHVLCLPESMTLSDDQFFDFCQVNRDLRIERTAHGEIIVMSPAGGGSSNRNLRLSVQIEAWAERDGTGVAFDSSGGFILPNKAMRSPDASWVERSRLVTLTKEQKDKFLPLCPDFAVELRSPSDRLSVLRRKMQEYIANGTCLGWLIDPLERKVHIYKPGEQPRILDNPNTLSGEPVLPGFELKLERIWDLGF